MMNSPKITVEPKVINNLAEALACELKETGGHYSPTSLPGKAVQDTLNFIRRDVAPKERPPLYKAIEKPFYGAAYLKGADSFDRIIKLFDALEWSEVEHEVQDMGGHKVHVYEAKLRSHDVAFAAYATVGEIEAVHGLVGLNMIQVRFRNGSPYMVTPCRVRTWKITAHIVDGKLAAWFPGSEPTSHLNIGLVSELVTCGINDVPARYDA